MAFHLGAFASQAEQDNKTHPNWSVGEGKRLFSTQTISRKVHYILLFTVAIIGRPSPEKDETLPSKWRKGEPMGGSGGRSQAEILFFRTRRIR